MGQGRFLFPDVKLVKSASGMCRTPSGTVCLLSAGAPQVVLTGTAQELAERLELSNFMISLSHEDDYAVAFVTALSPERQTAATPGTPSKSQMQTQSGLDHSVWLSRGSRLGAQPFPPDLGASPPLVDEGVSVFDELYDQGFQKPKS